VTTSLTHGSSDGEGRVLVPFQDLPDLTGAVLGTFGLMLLALLVVVLAIAVRGRFL